MFIYPNKYEEAGLSHNPFKAIVSPRPIGMDFNSFKRWPLEHCSLQFFNAISQPPMVMFSSAPKKENNGKRFTFKY